MCFFNFCENGSVERVSGGKEGLYACIQGGERREVVAVWVGGRGRVGSGGVGSGKMRSRRVGSRLRSGRVVGSGKMRNGR